MTEPTTRAERRAARAAAARGRLDAVLSPAFRRWAYGVTGAAIGVAIWAGWLPPGAAAVLAPLLMAIFYVDKTGTPRD